jgi:hypothetical protein
MWNYAMIEKQLRKTQITNMALWVFAIMLPIVAPAFTSKDPKIFDILMPMLQLMLAASSTRMFGALLKSAQSSPQHDVEAK